MTQGQYWEKFIAKINDLPFESKVNVYSHFIKGHFVLGEGLSDATEEEQEIHAGVDGLMEIKDENDQIVTLCPDNEFDPFFIVKPNAKLK